MCEISRCDNGACYNENLIEEQAIEIQKLKTELSNLHDEYVWEQEVKNAFKSKYLKLQDLIITVIENSERHIQTSDDFWVYDNCLRMEIIDILSNR